LLAEDRYRLILTARESSLPRFGEEGIEEGPYVWLRSMDVVSPEDRLRVVEEVSQVWGGVDILINNAGVSYRSVVEHVSEEERLEQMGINFRAPMELIRMVLPGMREKRRGRIINVSSVGGMMAMPTMAVYSASKFALEGATESLWYEVRPWGIHVSLIQPGFVHSSSFKNTRLTVLSQHAIEDPQSPYYGHYHYMAPFIEKMMGWAIATPESIARKISRVMRKRRPPLRIAATLDAMLFSWLRRLLPQGLYHRLLYVFLPKIWRWGRGEPQPQPTKEGLIFAAPTVLGAPKRHGPHSPHPPRPSSKASPYAAPHAIQPARFRLL